LSHVTQYILSSLVCSYAAYWPRRPLTSDYIHAIINTLHSPCWLYTCGSPPGLWVGWVGASVSILKSISFLVPFRAFVHAWIPAWRRLAKFFSTYK